MSYDDFNAKLDRHIARTDAILVTLGEVLAVLKTVELTLIAAQVGNAEKVYDSIVLKPERVGWLK